MVAVVQTKAIGGGYTGNFAANVTAGNTCFYETVAFSASNVTISSSNPTLGGSSVSGSTDLLTVQSAYDGTSTSYVASWMLPNCPGSVSSIALTVTNAGTFGSSGIVAYEVSGLGASPVLDQQASNSGSSTTISAGPTGAITSAPEFIVGVAANWLGAGAGPSGGGWTSTQTSGGGSGWGAQQIATSSGGTYSWSQTGLGGSFAAEIVTVAIASAGPAGTVQPRATVPVPRRRPARALWAQITGQAFVAVPAPKQEYQLAPRRKLARAVWRGGAGQAYVAVPAPVQQYRLAPRRKLARAYVQFVPVVTTNAAAVAGVAGTVPVLMVNQTRVVVRRDGRVVRR